MALKSPADSSNTKWAAIPKAVDLARDGKSFYVLGSDESAINESALVVGRYDTAGNLLWTRFIADAPPVNYTPYSIHVLPDSSVLCLASYVSNANPNHTDYYIFKLTKNGDPLDITNLSAQLSGDIAVWPNPATDNLYFSLTRTEAWTIVLSDVSGKEVGRHSALASEKASLPVAHLPAGMYSYRVTTATGKTYTGLWMKQ